MTGSRGESGDDPTDPALTGWVDACDVGSVYGGRYRIASELASGGMGVVYVADDTEDGRRVAFKILQRDYRDIPAVAKQFELEGQFLCTFPSPHIPRGFAYGFDRSCGPFLAMELLEGKPLHELYDCVAFTARQIAQLGADVARAIEPMHREKIIHRDLKPPNIFMTWNRRATNLKVLDWGIAKMRGMYMSVATGDQVPIGTLRYMSPEQLRGESIGPESDVYSLSIVLYELFAKHYCYGREALSFIPEHMYQAWHQVGTLIPLTDYDLEGSEMLWPVLERGLARNPRDRFPSMMALAVALERAHATMQSNADTEFIETRAHERLLEEMGKPSSSNPRSGLPTRYGLRVQAGELLEEGRDVLPLSSSQGGAGRARVGPMTPRPLPEMVSGVIARLEVLDGPSRQRFYDLTPVSITIGRSLTASVPIDEVTLSSIHAELLPAPSVASFLLVDRKSRNGTLLNGATMVPGVPSRPLEHGDRITLGRVVFSFLLPAAIDTGSLTPAMAEPQRHVADGHLPRRPAGPTLASAHPGGASAMSRAPIAPTSPRRPIRTERMLLATERMAPIDVAATRARLSAQGILAAEGAVGARGVPVVSHGVKRAPIVIALLVVATLAIVALALGLHWLGVL